jgi:hypothetical protein
MKTFEEWWEEFKEVHDEWRFANSGALRKAAWNAAIETMRQDCEPVFYADKWAVESALADNDKFDISVGVRNASNKIDTDIPLYTHPQPLRELSREEVMKLWLGMEGTWRHFPDVLTDFAKLVREVK